jgi:hypothetical protein
MAESHVFYETFSLVKILVCNLRCHVLDCSFLPLPLREPQSRARRRCQDHFVYSYVAQEQGGISSIKLLFSNSSAFCILLSDLLSSLACTLLILPSAISSF